MAFSPSFTITPLSTPGSFTITDASTGSDASIVDRQILLYQTNNTLLVSAIDFPLSAGSSITISPLTQDIALNVVVQWNYSGGVTQYSSQQIQAFVAFGQLFQYTLSQKQSTTPNITGDTLYYYNRMKLQLGIDSALQAISIGLDLQGAQVCINQYNNMLTNSAYYF